MDQANGGGMSSRASVAVLIAIVALACGRIVSSYSTFNQTYDEGLHMACCASIALAAFCMMRWAEEPSRKRAAILAAALAFAVMCKMSAVVFLSVCGVALAVAYWVYRRDGKTLALSFRLRQLALVLAGAVVLIWGGYRFSVIRLA